MMKQGALRPMKDSGVEWLGKIPAAWELTRTKFLFSLAQRRPREDDEIVTAFRDGQVTLRSNRRTDGFTNALKESGYQGVRKGDLVIHAMDAFAGAIGVSDSSGKCTPVYSCCIPKSDANSMYYAHCVRTMATTGYIGSLAKGIRERSTDFRWATFAEQFLPVPLPDEQEEIVGYLNRATTRIDALVAKKTRFIELLREKRQALITRAVTRGLDPAVPMKDSGVEWLGRVPAHWRVLRFKLSTKSCQNGIWGEEPKGGDDDVECVRVADFNRPTLTVNEVIPTLRAVAEKDRTTRLLRRGNLLLEKSGGGENQPVGQVVLYNRDQYAVCSNFVARIELQAGMEPRFWNYQHHVAYSARINVRSIKQTSGIQNLDHHQYLNELAVFPPLDEQVSIADFLDRNTTRIDTLIARTERSIELLREKRTALITAAVTGKLDLREAA